MPRTIFVIQGSHWLTDHRAHGDGLVAWGFIKALAERGHRLHVAAPIIDVHGPVPPSVTLHTLEAPGRGQFRDAVDYMRRVRELYERVAARERIDLAHQMNPVLRGLSLALVGIDVPIVLGTYVGDWPEPPARTLSERTVRVTKAALDALQQLQADAIVLATPHALGRVPFRRLVDDRIAYLHHGVDTELYTPEPRDGDPPHDGPTVLYLGSLERKKGIRTMVDAFAIAAAAVPGARLVLIGFGGEEPDMRGWLDAHGIADRATFLGRMSREDVARWVRAADVLCAPSLGEPYGQNVLEAMASGKPVVATTVGGHPHLVDAGAGATVDPYDAAATGTALVALLRDPSAAAGIGAHNRSVALARHAWSQVAAELERIYERAIVRRSHRLRRDARGR